MGMNGWSANVEFLQDFCSTFTLRKRVQLCQTMGIVDTIWVLIVLTMLGLFIVYVLFLDWEPMACSGQFETDLKVRSIFRMSRCEAASIWELVLRL